jgi:hypothetical protein
MKRSKSWWHAGAGLVVLALAGCAAEGARPDEDGSVAVGCTGGFDDWSGCYNRAQAACGAAGYEILSRVSNEGSSGVGTRDWSVGGSEISRTLVVRCRGG